MFSYTLREERRSIYERCLWCSNESEEAAEGTIQDESASGILLETEKPLAMSQRIWILMLPDEEITRQELSPEDIIHHPLSRTGIVVRQESPLRAGIRFDDSENKRLSYQRWYRGGSLIVTLSAEDWAVITLSGELNFESAVFLERIFSKSGKPQQEILFSCHEVKQVNNTALTVLRSVIRQCDKSGVMITIIAGSTMAESLGKNIGIKNGCLANIDAPPLQTKRSLKRELEAEAANGSHGVVLLARGAVGLNRLSAPMIRLGIPSWKTQNFREAANLIAFNKPLFVIVDVEIEQCPMLLELNRLEEYELEKLPPIMVIGPPHLSELIRTALKPPVKVYISKPYTDRDYMNGLKAMINQEYNMQKIQDAFI
ncbi:MAG: hypothetical protein JXR73_09880 [Candidatus Omnitrophica bacterium]|nr:hypothetical protein [Candidatus Omnitrophota bacterium]